jgi:gliding motility-associated protein GldM
LLVGPKPDVPRQDPWSAFELRTKLEGFRDQLKGIELTNATGGKWSLSDGLKTTLDSSFSYKSQMEANKEVSWETKNFFHVPLAAIITYLSTVETTVKKAKADVLEELQKGINAKDLKFTDVTVAVVPKQSYVLKGDSFVTEVYLAAFDKTRQTKVYIGGEYSGQPGVATEFSPGSEVYTSGPDGKVRIKKLTGGMSIGDHGYRGMIEYQDADGSAKRIPFNIPPFTVAEPALVVSPTKMNVFYRGLPNPIEISVPGADLNKIEASCSGHQLVKDGAGKFTITPGAGAEADISVVAEINGKKTNMGTKKFRVKRMPDPVPNFNGKYPTDNVITKSTAKNAQGIIPEMKDFDFEAKPTIKSFTLVVVSSDGKVNEQPSSANRITDGQKGAIDKLKPGQSFSLENILCKMPDGTERKLSNITLRIING